MKRPRNKRAKILVTGFGPFPGVANNPSGQLAQALARSRRAKRTARVSALVIPTTYTDTAKLPQRIAREKPDAVLMFGLAGRARVLRVETRGRNQASTKHLDATGKKAHRVLVPGAPKLLKTTAPAARLVKAARSTGAHARLSIDAGGYVCNAAIFHILNGMRGEKAPPVAFVHIPWPREYAGGRQRPTFAALQRAAEAMLVAMVRQPA
jgi:pyroglutamyl-peptidase